MTDLIPIQRTTAGPPAVVRRRLSEVFTLLSRKVIEAASCAAVAGVGTVACTDADLGRNTEVLADMSTSRLASFAGFAARKTPSGTCSTGTAPRR